MILYKHLALLLIAVLVLPSGALAEKKTVVLTTSMLENALETVRPEKADIEVIRILPPAACPGHFDLSPRILPGLKRASVILRHDYQVMLENKIEGLGLKDVSVVAINTDGTPLIPAYYAQIIGKAASINSALFPAFASEVANREREYTKSLEELGRTLQAKTNPSRGTKIIAAAHLREFCEWLGFDVIGVIKRPEETTPRDIAELAKLKADFVAANLQEGRKSAEALAELMHIPVAVLSNFPGAEGFGSDYASLITENTERLIDVCRKR